MHRATVRIYEERGGEWAARRRPVRRDDARAFAARVPPGAVRADLGCGAGRYTGDLATPVVALDAAAAMLDLAAAAVPSAWYVQADLEALPLRRRALHASWANMSYLHVPRRRLPLALADLHRAMTVGAPLDIQVLAGDYEGDALASDDVGGRFFSAWGPGAFADVAVGAGFELEHVAVVPTGPDDVVRAIARRARSLADTVGEGMRLLVCGLNPSVYAADAGVGYARPGNRFWPAAVAAGVVSVPNDPLHALVTHGVGMTDLVKRATPRAADVGAGEYRAGAERVERLVSWMEPAAVCFVGLAGWRAAVDSRALPGWQPAPFGGRPAYVMPSTSGLNARTSFAELVDHLRAASSGAPRARAAGRTPGHERTRGEEAAWPTSS